MRTTTPPCFLLIQLFRRSKARKNKSAQLRQIVSIKARKAEREKSRLGLTDLNRESTQDGFNSKAEENISPKNTKYSVKNKKKKLLFPWWTKIIAYLLSFAFAGVCLFFTVIKGIEFGDEKVQKWISSLAISFLSSILLTQPIQVLLLAFFFVIVFRKYDDNQDSQPDNDDDGESLNDMFKYSKFKNSSDQIMGQFASEFNVPKESELETARAARIREIKVWNAIREIFIYCIFLCLLFAVGYQSNGTNPYNYQAMIKKVFEPEIRSIDDFWQWSFDKLAVNLRAGRWYNSRQPYGLAGFTNDYTSRMLGYATFRQVRVKNNSCNVLNYFNKHIDFCTDDLSISNYDEQKYGFNWTNHDENFKPEHGTEQIYNAFQYRDSSSLKTFPIAGQYNTYLGGGYVYELRGKMDYLRGNMSLLQQMNWIDRQTRAIIIEFSVYNPNMNLIMVSCILVEVLPSGNLLTTARFDPLNLFSEVQSNSYILKLVFDALYMVFIVYFMIKQIITIIKTGFIKYFKQFWNYIEWSVIILSWACCGIFLYRLTQAYEVLDFFKQTSGYGYLNLQRVNYWNQLLTSLMGLTCGLGTLKFLKLLRFNNKIYSIANTLKYSIQHLMGFSLIFLIIWLSFVQLMYLFFFERLSAYYTIFRSSITSFQIMLGKFDGSSLLRESSILGTLIFSFYNIMVVLILLNIFISIVCDAFEKVRVEMVAKDNEIEIIDFIIEKMDQFLGGSKKKRENNFDREHTYVENHEGLPNKVDSLLAVVAENVRKNENNQ